MATKSVASKAVVLKSPVSRSTNGKAAAKSSPKIPSASIKASSVKGGVSKSASTKVASSKVSVVKSLAAKKATNGSKITAKSSTSNGNGLRKLVDSKPAAKIAPRTSPQAASVSSVSASSSSRPLNGKAMTASSRMPSKASGQDTVISEKVQSGLLGNGRRMSLAAESSMNAKAALLNNKGGLGKGMNGGFGPVGLDVEVETEVVIDFKVGDKVVYPPHGVGVIEAIEVRMVSNIEQKFYKVSILEPPAIFRVALSQVRSVGLRRIVDHATVEKVYTILRDRNVVVDTQTWNRRFRDYSQRIKTGSVLEIAKVIRELAVLKGDKELSFGERRMLESAQGLLVKEISIAKASSEESIKAELMSICGFEPSQPAA